MAIKQYQNYLFVPVILEELVTATKNSVPNDRGCVTETELNVDYISLVGCVKNKIMQHKKIIDNKPTDDIVPNSFVIGDDHISLSVFPYPNDLDTQEAIGSLMEGDYVHIDGIYGFFNDKAKITVLNIRRISDNPLMYLNVWYIKMLKQRIGEKLPLHSLMYTHFIKDQYGQYGKIEGDFFIFQGFPSTMQFTQKGDVSPPNQSRLSATVNEKKTEAQEEYLLEQSVIDSEKIKVSDIISSPKRKKTQSQASPQPTNISQSSVSIPEDQFIAYLIQEAAIPKEKILKLKEKLGSFEKVAETLDIPLPKIADPPKNVSSPVSELSGDAESLCFNYLTQVKQKCTVADITAAVKLSQSKVLSSLVKMAKSNKISQTYTEDGNALFYV